MAAISGYDSRWPARSRRSRSPSGRACHKSSSTHASCKMVTTVPPQKRSMPKIESSHPNWATAQGSAKDPAPTEHFTMLSTTAVVVCDAAERASMLKAADGAGSLTLQRCCGLRKRRAPCWLRLWDAKCAH